METKSLVGSPDIKMPCGDPECRSGNQIVRSGRDGSGPGIKVREGVGCVYVGVDFKIRVVDEREVFREFCELTDESDDLYWKEEKKWDFEGECKSRERVSVTKIPWKSTREVFSTDEGRVPR